MSQNLIKFGGNTATAVTKQGKYRVVHRRDGFAIEVVIETPDGIRSYPTSQEHPELIRMVNAVKVAAEGREGGQFYINESQQVIVPAGNPVKYFFAGEYRHHIVLKLDHIEFSGRPHDDQGNLLKPGDRWTGRPRPGIKYTLMAGGTDIRYVIELSPDREQIVRLSRQVGEERARRTARKIATVRGNAGGAFYINEFRALFGPRSEEDGYNYVFIGVLTDEDAWFEKWSPSLVTSPAPVLAPGGTPPTAVTVPIKATYALPSDEEFVPLERKMEIADGTTGHSMDSLFGAYLRGAKTVTLEDAFMVRPHQLANLLRFCELLVRLGTVKSINLVTREVTDDSRARLETIKRSLSGYEIAFTYSVSNTLHDRQITTDTGWEISLGRGLDIYKRPDDWLSVGATEFALRPCYETTLIFHRLSTGHSRKASA